MKKIYIGIICIFGLFNCQKNPEPKVEFSASELEWINVFALKKKFNYTSFQSSMVLEVDSIIDKPYKKKESTFGLSEDLRKIILFKNKIKMSIYFSKSDANSFEILYPIVSSINPQTLQNRFTDYDSLFILKDTILGGKKFENVIKYVSYYNPNTSKPTIFIFNKSDGIVQFTNNDTLWTLKK